MMIEETLLSYNKLTRRHTPEELRLDTNAWHTSMACHYSYILNPKLQNKSVVYYQ
jgi:hypothetical protein